jgi:hypothetical protein
VQEFSCAACIPTQDAKNTALVMRRQKQEEIKDYLKRLKLITKQDIQLMKIMPLRNVTCKKKNGENSYQTITKLYNANNGFF